MPLRDNARRNPAPLLPFLLAVIPTLLCCFIRPVFAQQACVAPPSGIIAWWPLDTVNGHSAPDIVGNQIGTLLDGVISADGYIDAAVRFDGTTGYVAVPDNDAWAFGNRDFTIEFWANSSAGGSVGHPGSVFIGNDEGPGALNKWFFALGGGYLNFHINSPTVGAQFFSLVPFSPTVGVWYHLAVTRSGATYTIYINGKPAGNAVNAATVPNANAPLTIGRANEPFGGFMNGRLDEMTLGGHLKSGQ